MTDSRPKKYDVLVWMEQQGADGVDAGELAEEFGVSVEEAAELLARFTQVGLTRWCDETDRFRVEGRSRL